MAPSQIQPAVREGLLVPKVVHQACERPRVACVVVNGHLRVGRAAPAARVFKAVRPRLWSAGCKGPEGDNPL